MLTVDCADVTSIQNELVVYVADKVEAIPTLKNHQFTLSTLDDEIIDVELVISAIKEYFDFINEGSNFAVISNKEIIHIKSVTGQVLQRESEPQQSQLFSCTHCGFVTQYQVELNVHMRMHYL
ncbi:C2H2-type zinc finger protein [Nitrosopumilus sp.]|uniref:Zinc finger C2H2-type domain-containing protein n=1 Tax=uncultured marine thaumarchaeote AD1000_07_E11 TaxID=1455886 RepID=A0A075FI93_9ARCH|nr:C2H2-type zinc finger protein [Nitrosopumilus sp.]AIE90833.1 zinc finger C2H2-type domain-containing protein [uncultured marine thaumarchaeote AD1000_07_E11]MCH1519176.1 C2H2-type zinc finger protein [Nitrosopumilus sp.]MCH1549006.1 C2H2-type zinc finger protein [Nitrosopumilus sp.]MDB4839696.1 C2H2-type zinc finger protein [Nitrosopumilus sp.]MDC0070057.1 C2H2-type zinc finger protein [Nitrosopumilus sp.]|tara:strand:+ start:375 stop:743 length:369 start_codon:yes stop_codon:yes gene_type:complete